MAKRRRTTATRRKPPLRYSTDVGRTRKLKSGKKVKTRIKTYAKGQTSTNKNRDKQYVTSRKHFDQFTRSHAKTGWSAATWRAFDKMNAYNKKAGIRNYGYQYSH